MAFINLRILSRFYQQTKETKAESVFARRFINLSGIRKGGNELRGDEEVSLKAPDRPEPIAFHQRELAVRGKDQSEQSMYFLGFGRSLRTGVLKRQGSCWNKGPDGQCPLICQNSHFAQFCRSIPELKNYPVCVNKSSFLIEIHNYLKLKIVSWVVRCTFAISTGQLTDCGAEVDIVVWVTEWVQRGLAAAHLSFGPPLEKKPFIKCQYHKIVRVPLKYMWGVGV